MTTQQRKLFLSVPLLLTAVLPGKPGKSQPVATGVYLPHNIAGANKNNTDAFFAPLLALPSDTTPPPPTRAPEVLTAPQAPLHPAAVKSVARFLKQNREDLQKACGRSVTVFPVLEPILERYGVPIELKYLAVVESNLESGATSRVGAKGPWQFMKGTARELGLKVSKGRDDRKNYAKSTEAAGKYLRDLYRRYDDWLLVVAAYNAGPGNVDKAIRRTGSRNFWKLQHRLPAETRAHVKHYIATHYFFEGRGGQTTLTKEERLAYEKEIALFRAKTQNSDAVAAKTTSDSAKIGGIEEAPGTAFAKKE